MYERSRRSFHAQRRKCRKLSYTPLSYYMQPLLQVVCLQRWFRWRRAVRQERAQLLYHVRRMQKLFRRKYAERHCTTYINDTCFITLEPFNCKWQELWFVHQRYRFLPKHLTDWIMESGEFVNPYTRQKLVKGDLLRLHALMRIADPFYEELDFHVWEDRMAIRAQARRVQERQMLQQFWVDTLDQHLTWFWNMPEDVKANMECTLLYEYQNQWDAFIFDTYRSDLSQFWLFHAPAAQHYINTVLEKLDVVSHYTQGRRLYARLAKSLQSMIQHLKDYLTEADDAANDDDDDDYDDDDDDYPDDYVDDDDNEDGDEADERAHDREDEREHDREDDREHARVDDREDEREQHEREHDREDEVEREVDHEREEGEVVE